MGVSHSPAALADKLTRLAHALDSLDVELTRDAALLTKNTILAGAPARLRGVGKRGAKLSVGYNLTTTAVEPAALVFARGPWQFIEEDTAPHDIPRATARKRGRRRYAVIPGVGVRATVRHPGTRGQHPWRNGVVAAREPVGALLRNRTHAVIGKVF